MSVRKKSALSILLSSVARLKRLVNTSLKAVRHSLKAACNGAVGRVRTARNGASTRWLPNGSNSCRERDVRKGWSARVQRPHVQGRRVAHPRCPHAHKRQRPHRRWISLRLLRTTIFLSNPDYTYCMSRSNFFGGKQLRV